MKIFKGFSDTTVMLPSINIYSVNLRPNETNYCKWLAMLRRHKAHSMVKQ